DAQVLRPGGWLRLTRQEFDDLFERFESESLHVEMRDMYGTQAEIGPFAKWVAGEPDDLKWLDGWCETLRRGAAKGKVFRRVCVVSEPLSDYQRWTHSLTSQTRRNTLPLAAPRRRVS